MALTLITGPAKEPIELADAKLQIKRGDITEDDRLIKLLIAAARERAEAATQRALITQTWELKLDAFPPDGWIEVPKAPLQSITSITYLDMAGVEQTWSSTLYVTEAPAGPRARRGRVSLPFSGVWPVALPQMAAIRVRFVCGYGDDASDVPSLVRQAMLLDLAALYENRSGVVTPSGSAPVEIPMGVRDIYWAYRSHPTQRWAA